MFNELQAVLARRKSSSSFDITDAEPEPTFPDDENIKRHSSAQLEAFEAAALRRQRSFRDAEINAAEKAGQMRRDKLAKSAAAERDLSPIRTSKSGILSVRDEIERERQSQLTRVVVEPPLVKGSYGVADAPAPSPANHSPAADAFARFLGATDVADTQLHFMYCMTNLSLAWPTKISTLSKLLSPLVPHRSRQLLTGLAAKQARAEYAPPKGVRPRAALSVIVIGAGPVGLRTAIELALLGCRCEVLESRESFTRLQVLHLWEWVENDLIDLGIKSIDPSIFAAADLRRCSTAQLQHSLFKVALLLGVKVRFGCRVDSVDSLSSLHRRRIDMLVDASGARCELLNSLGFCQEVSLKSQKALCIVISLANNKSPEELELRESTWSQQYFQAEFGALATNGVILENLVYYRSTGAFADAATHYFVMTTTSDALHAYGALRELIREGELCAKENVDYDMLERYARQAISAFVPELSRQEIVPNNLTIFDFSERKQSNRAATIVSGAALGELRQETSCLVARVGDALQEPFWPEGLGINRGFLGALDCAELAQRCMPLLLKPLGQPKATLEDFDPLLRRREEIFGLTKRLSGSNRLKELKPHLDPQRRYCYSLDPRTRYASWNRAEPAPNSARGAAPGGPPRMSFHVSGWSQTTR